MTTIYFLHFFLESSQQQYPYRTLLGRMLIGSPFKAEYSINKIYDQHEMSGATCQYQGILTLQSLQQLPQQEYQQFSQQYMTPELYPSIDHALEAAAKMAYSSVYRSSQPSVYVQPNAMLTPSPFPCSGSDSTGELKGVFQFQMQHTLWSHNILI